MELKVLVNPTGTQIKAIRGTLLVQHTGKTITRPWRAYLNGVHVGIAATREEVEDQLKDARKRP